MNNQTLRDKIQKSDLPKCVVKHLITCIDKGRCHRWHDVMDTTFDGVISSAKNIIDRACIATGRDKESLFRDTDFDPRDLDPDRLDSAFAELRGINYLSNNGFKDIYLLRAQPGTRTADIVTKLDINTYALDVACASAGTPRNVNDLVDYIIGIYKVKDAQLQSTIESYNCTKSGLVFVINSYPALAFGYQPLFLKAAQKAHLELGANNNFHIVIVTGRVAFAGIDDVAHPAWR